MTPTTPAVTPLLAGRRALIAEDSHAQQRLLSFMLGRAGMTVVLAEDGNEAVARAGREPFDVILLDMQMPSLDGYAAAAALRQQGFRGPIIALTADTRSGDEQRCLDAGCDDYLGKPIDPARLLGLVMRHLTASLPVTAAPSATVASFEDLLREYVGGLDRRLAEFRAALSADDREALSSLAHKTRGAAAMYGLTTLAETAGLIEEAVREQQDRELLAELLNELEGEVRLVAVRHPPI